MCVHRKSVKRTVVPWFCPCIYGQEGIIIQLHLGQLGYREAASKLSCFLLLPHLVTLTTFISLDLQNNCRLGFNKSSGWSSFQIYLTCPQTIFTHALGHNWGSCIFWALSQDLVTSSFPKLVAQLLLKSQADPFKVLQSHWYHHSKSGGGGVCVSKPRSTARCGLWPASVWSADQSMFPCKLLSCVTEHTTWTVLWSFYI